MTQTTPTRNGPPAGAASDPGGPPRRRAGAVRSAAGRMRAAAGTEPGRLRLIGVALAVLVLAFGAATAWQITGRSTATGHVLHHSAPLSADAAEIYRSLADADATVTAGFLVGGQEPASVTARYTKDIDTAAKLITQASANSDGSADTAAQLSSLNRQLPYYTQLVATARADDLQGLPLGGAYLRFADQQMQQPGGLLDAADQLYRAETARLNADYADAESLPWTAWAFGAAALAALLWAQRRHFRHTNRVFNPGLLGASAACVVALLWLVVGHTVARAQLTQSYQHGARSLHVLNDARIAVLQTRGNENLTLVARGSGSAYEQKYRAGMDALAGSDPAGVGGALAQARVLADDPEGRAPVDTAIKAVQTWRVRHAQARRSDDGGDYPTAVADVIGGRGGDGKPVTATTGQNFDVVDTSLEQAVGHEQQEFHRAADAGRGALSLLPFGTAALAVLAAAGAALGIGRRLAEYR